MPDFNVQIITNITITARDAEQADERSEMLTQWLDYSPPKSKQWTQSEQEVEWTVGEVDAA